MPELAYESQRARLYVGDCRDVVAEGALGAVDLMVTDPPYGVGFRSNFGRNHAALVGDDDPAAVIATLGRCANALRNYRHVYVFGYTPEELVGPMQLGGTCQLLWDKGILGMGDLAATWAQQTEPITFGVRVQGSASRALRSGNLSARLRRGNVLRVPRKNSVANRRHPTEKPVALLRQLIESSSMIGETVFDPFAGVGSTLVAALVSGRCAVGVEIDPKFIPVAVERIVAAERIADMVEAA